jgi:nucleoside-triphosphatase
MKIWLVSGVSGSGKTTFCTAMAQRALALGRDVAGLLSPSLFVDGRRTEIWAEALRSGQRRRLAGLERKSAQDLAFGVWFFDVGTLEWGNAVLRKSTACDLLVIDELGPLEFNLGQGWVSAFEVLAAGQFRRALVVVRPELLACAQAMWQQAEVIYASEASSCSATQARILA